ncbi:sensor histidine kinase [Paractinoplanes brasiliensis]|uniref:histidine kinase n=1 Tax=Paractinoplanes brasiliensis TaxID=52695 RepID=A0A4R6J8X9_9ACTN|nr:HAMP domain-containing sensor histidine kinase [Actinoplanes brasiliensis]TDO31627.1 signal transduction histidine kinase [Actinoplanes brasiliensis]GID30781.1 two-component sensor histidine kinase [Actinoplanes brasiliensis]
MKRPEVFRSVRFRLTVVYSTVLFALAGLTLGVVYLAVAQSTSPRPVTERIAKVYSTDREYLGTTTVAEVSEIEAAVNYNTLTSLRRWSFIGLGGLFVASLGIGWVLSGRVLRPVGAITRTAREIQATDLSRRIRLGGPPDELRDLADTIDSMLDRLDHAFQAQRQLIDDASHELRSPLAIIRTNLDASLTAPDATPEERTRAVAVVDRATTRMSRLVEDLLATARRDSNATVDAEVDLSAVAREAGEESFVTERPLHLRYETAAGLRLIGDADALRRAVGNLLSNAVRLAPSHSTVTVATGQSGSWLWLAVADEGPGIAPADLARVFDRFWRGQDGEANGVRRERRTGLGLAIVRQIIESHGGRVAAFSPPGNGSTFVLWLPAADRTDEEPPPSASPL